MGAAVISNLPSLSAGSLRCRGHDVRMAVPPNLIGFTEAAGLEAVAYGLDSKPIMDLQRKILYALLSHTLEVEGADQDEARNRGVRHAVLGRDDPRRWHRRLLAPICYSTGLIFDSPPPTLRNTSSATLHFFPRSGPRPAFAVPAVACGAAR